MNESTNSPDNITSLDPNRVQEMTDWQKDIRNKIHDCLNLAEDDIEIEDIQLETPLFDFEHGLGLDSLDALEIVTRLSNDYEISFDESDMEDFISVKTLSSFVEGQLNQQ